jgi:hypothetical protein
MEERIRKLAEFSSEGRDLTLDEFVERFPHPFLLVGRFQSQEGSAFGTVMADNGLNSEDNASDTSDSDLDDENVYPIVKSGRNTFEKLFTVGRSPNNDIVIDHTSISKLHAYFRQEDDGYTIADAGSSNGTFIEEFPLPQNKDARIESNQPIRFGKTIIATFYTAPDFYRFIRAAR